MYCKFLQLEKNNSKKIARRLQMPFIYDLYLCMMILSVFIQAIRTYTYSLFAWLQQRNMILHSSLKFAMERGSNSSIAFLDMKIINSIGILSLICCKPSDIGLSPKPCKRSLLSGFVHRSFRACSSWKHFHESITKAENIL